MFLTIAKDRYGFFKNISEVESGKTELFCPFCTGVLIAKKGKIKEHHFAHEGDTCRESKRALRATLIPTFDHFELLDKHEQKYIERRIKYRSHANVHYFQGYNEAIKSLEFMGIISVDRLSKAAIKANEHLKLLDKSFVKDGQPSGMASKVMQALVHTSPTIFTPWATDKAQDTEITQAYYDNRLDKQQTFAELEKAQRFWLDCHWRKMAYLGEDYQQLLKSRIEALNAQHLYIFEFNIVIQEEEKRDTPKVIQKIGMTTRTAKERLAEVKTELSKYHKIKSARVLGYAKHAGRIERLIHRKYADLQFKMGSMTEFFYINEALAHLLKDDINSLNVKPYTPKLKAVTQDKEKQADQYTEKKIESVAGRKKKTPAEFIAEYPEIVNLLKQRKGIREINRITGASVNTVQKVKKALSVS